MVPFVKEDHRRGLSLIECQRYMEIVCGAERNAAKHHQSERQHAEHGGAAFRMPPVRSSRGLGSMGVTVGGDTHKPVDRWHGCVFHTERSVGTTHGGTYQGAAL